MSFIIDILTNLGLQSLLPKSLLTKDGQLSTPVLIAASSLPIIANLIWTYSHTVVEVTDPEQVRWMQNWLAHRHDTIRRARRITLVPAGSMIGSRSRSRYAMLEKMNHNDETEIGERFTPPKLIEALATGVSIWLWYGWIPISVESSKRNMSLTEMFSIRNPEESTVPGCHITVWLTPNRSEVAKKILLEGRQLWVSKRSTKTEILTLNEGMAKYGRIDFQVVTRPSRPLSSVIIEGGIKNELLHDMTRFLSGEKWYICKGIPYRRGYLLYGPAGCGKTSLITALAGHFRLPIVVVPLGGSVDDNTLRDTLTTAPRDAIILFEDIDCALPAGKRNDSIPTGMLEMAGGKLPPDLSQRVTLSGLLNAIDGVAAQEGRILFMTTNYKNRLDDALIRPGRVDMQFHLQKASKSAAGELFDQFFVPEEYPEDDAKIDLQKARSAFLNEIEDGVHSFATLQGALMQARDDPNFAADEMRKVFISMDDKEKDTLDTTEPNKVDDTETEKMDNMEQDNESKLSSKTEENQDMIQNPTDSDRVDSEML